MSDISVRRLSGATILPHLDDLARLRCAVFRDWPYLYEGDLSYEARYLAAYARSPDSVFVLAFEGEHVIGAASGIPLVDDEAHFHAPFHGRGIDVQRVFYFGESVLLPAYRGQGLGHRFFDEREAHARELGRFDVTAFCSVDRAADDPRRPSDARSNDAFWHKRGYARQEGIRCQLSWRELGQSTDTLNTLTVWMRTLD